MFIYYFLPSNFNYLMNINSLCLIITFRLMYYFNSFFYELIIFYQAATNTHIFIFNKNLFLQ